jgi:transposase
MSKALEEQTREELIATVGQLQFRLNELERMIFGRKSERFVPSVPSAAPLQMGLFGDLASAEESTPVKEQLTYERKKPKAKNANHPGRNELPAHLERIEIELQPEENTTEMKFIGWEVSEKLGYDPGRLYVNRYKRAKYARPEEAGIVCASLPTHLFDKCIAEPNLMTKITVDKYVDHLPVDRQFKAFKRQGIDLPSSTAYDWIKQVAQRLEVLYEALIEAVMQSAYIQVDESPIQVLDKELKGKTHRGYMWVFRAPVSKLVFFHYHPGRDKNFPKEQLKNFKGYLQTDAYVAYDQFKQHPDIIALHCLAHARREFEKALSNDKARAEYALQCFQKLYALEQKARDQNLDYDGRKALRQDKAVPILNELEDWMEQMLNQTTPSSPIGAALRYYLARKAFLRRYVDDGRLEIDNNLIENAIRPLALGRKNYLFAGSHQAAQRAAIFYSIFACCAQHNINPSAYLNDILCRLPDYPINRIEELLPQRWKID